MKAFLSFGGIEAVARLLNWPILIVLPLLISANEYGNVRLLVAVETIAAGILLLGQDRTVLRYYGTEESPGSLLRTILMLAGVLAGSSLLLLAAAWSFGYRSILGLPIMPHLFVLFVGISLFNVNRLCVGIGRVEQSVGQFARFRLGFQAVKFCGVIACAAILRTSLGYVLGFVLGGVSTLVRTVPFLRSRARGTATRQMTSRLVTFGYPLVFHMLGLSILSQLSIFMIAALATREAVGLYGFAVSVATSVFLSYALLSTYFEPLIYKAADDCRRREQRLAVFGLMAVALASLGGIAVLLVAPWVVARYYRPEYLEALPVMPTLLAYALMHSLYLQGNYRLVACQRTWLIALGSVLSGLVNVALNLLLIPRWQIFGAAWALFASDVVLALFLQVVSRRQGAVAFQPARDVPLVMFPLAGATALVFVPHTTVQVLVLAAVLCCAVLALAKELPRFAGSATPGACRSSLLGPVGGGRENA